MAGSEEAPFQHDLRIVLRGNLDPEDPDNDPLPMMPPTPHVGWKAIGGLGCINRELFEINPPAVNLKQGLFEECRHSPTL